MRKWAIAAVFLLVAFAGVAIGYYLNPAGLPPVKGYMEGKEIRFIHTEVSDGKVAELLTAMMGSPVLFVPSLKQAPESMVAPVYVFKNGVKKGEGPFKFQSDVFENPPGTSRYSPLREVHIVTWKDERIARELKSAAEVKDVVSKGEAIIEKPGIVVNMPLLTWPGGRR